MTQLPDEGYFQATYANGNTKIFWAEDLGDAWRRHVAAREIEPVEIILKKPKYLEHIPDGYDLD